jgi:hypothetical protein
MTHQEILDLTRGLLDDVDLPRKWEDSELIIYENRCLNDIAREALCFTDSETEAVCRYAILSGQGLYTFDTRIIKSYSGTLDSDTVPLTRTNMALLNKYAGDWRTRETDNPTHFIPVAEKGKFRVWPMFYDDYVFTGSATFVAATKKITAASGLDVFEDGDEISIDGSTSNDGIFTLASDGVATQIEVDETLTSEGPVTVTIRKVMDYINLFVARFPLTPATTANLSNTPELHFQYHDRLPDGIMKYAFLKRDTMTYDPQSSANHGKLFRDSINEIKRDNIFEAHFDDVVSPHPGTL